jgi:DNA polymerase-3 subunit delta
MTLPVFQERRLVVVKNERLPAEARDAFAGYLKDPLASTTLVLFSEERKADPKDALVRAASAAGAICVFSPLKEGEAQERLQAEARKAGKTLAPEAAQALVAEAGTDWGILSQELEKALLYAGSSKEISAEAVLECLGYRKSSDPFALPRLIGARRLKESLSHLRRMLAEGKPDEQVFKALHQITNAVSRQFRAKRMLAAGLPPEEIFRSLRLNSWWDRDYLGNLARLGERRLVRDLSACLAAETALKSKSWLDPRIELEHLVVALCGADQALAAAS